MDLWGWGGYMPDPAPGLVAQAFSQHSISLRLLFTPLTALGGFQSHSNLGTMLGPFQPQHGPEVPSSFLLYQGGTQSTGHLVPKLEAGSRCRSAPGSQSTRISITARLPKATVGHTAVHHKPGSEAFFSRITKRFTQFHHDLEATSGPTG